MDLASFSWTYVYPVNIKIISKFERQNMYI